MAILVLDTVDVKSHIVTRQHVLTFYNDMINPMDGFMCALGKTMIQCKDDLVLTVKLACLKMSKYYPVVTSMTGVLLI